MGRAERRAVHALLAHEFYGPADGMRLAESLRAWSVAPARDYEGNEVFVTYDAGLDRFELEHDWGAVPEVELDRADFQRALSTWYVAMAMLRSADPVRAARDSRVFVAEQGAVLADVLGLLEDPPRTLRVRLESMR